MVIMFVKLVGIALAFYLAYRSFHRRAIQLGDEPTLPRYFTPRGVYWVGILSYCCLVTLVFWLLIEWWLPVAPLLQVLITGFSQGDFAGMIASLDGRTLLPWMVAFVFLLLINWENRLNPLLIIRDTIHDAFSIPRKVVEVFNMLRSSRLSKMDKTLKEQIVSRLWVPSIELGDFDKSDSTVEYKWAQNCVLFDKINGYANDNSFQRFFTEPSLKWGDICLSFNRNSEKVAAWRNTPPHYTKTVTLLQELDTLNRLLCRLLSCIVIFGSRSESEILDEVVKLGAAPNQEKLKHTYKYMLTFTAAVVLAVMVGREFAVFLHNNFLYPDDKLEHFAFDTLRWIVYVVPLYIFPVVLVFISRITAVRMRTSNEDRYYGFYILMMFIGFIVSTSVSAFILGLSADGEFSFLSSFVENMRWGILPALMCGFVAFRMDMPVDDSEPKSVMVRDSLVRLLVWAAIAMVVMLYATDNLTVQDANLRFTIVVATMFVVGFMGAVSRFKLVKAEKESVAL